MVREGAAVAEPVANRATEIVAPAEMARQPAGTTRPHHHHPHPVGLLPAVQSLLCVLAVGLYVMTFTVQPIRIPSESMEPTLLVGDFMLMDKQIVAGDAGGLLPRSRVERGDVIVFHDPVDPAIHLVKRVIGIPGDTIHLRDGVVYRNGEPLKESYAVYRRTAANGYRDDFPDMQTMDAQANPNWWIRLRGLVHDGEVTVPADSYFVMGDNRNHSDDSRYWGFVPRDAIVGKPVLIYFSWRQPGFDDLETEPLRAVGDGAAAKTSFARWDRTFRVVR
jgi:signal peptidase I